LAVFALRTHNDPVENHLEQQEAPEPRRTRSFTDLVLGAIVAVLFAAAVTVAAVFTFDVNPAAPVVVVIGAIAGGSYAVRHVEEPALEAAAIGLIAGGLVALLFWPLFDVA
jgi:hypothetical protein